MGSVAFPLGVLRLSDAALGVVGAINYIKK